VHSNEQIRASPSGVSTALQRSQTDRISSVINSSRSLARC
jgi:hypothetical protein